MATWILPRHIARVGDVVVWGEHAHQLLAPVGSEEPGAQAVHQQAQLFMEPEELAQWLSSIELWLGFRLDGTRPWPVPPG